MSKGNIVSFTLGVFVCFAMLFGGWIGHNAFLDLASKTSKFGPIDLYHTPSFESSYTPCRNDGVLLGESRANYPGMRHLICLEEGDIVHYKQGINDRRATRSTEDRRGDLLHHWERFDLANGSWYHQEGRRLCKGDKMIVFQKTHDGIGDYFCYSNNYLYGALYREGSWLDEGNGTRLMIPDFIPAR